MAINSECRQKALAARVQCMLIVNAAVYGYMFEGGLVVHQGMGLRQNASANQKGGLDTCTARRVE